jgi:hypothetical protein
MTPELLSFLLCNLLYPFTVPELGPNILFITLFLWNTLSQTEIYSSHGGKILIVGFWIVTPCDLHPEYGGDTFLQNTGNHLQDHTG